jgi:CHAT domain-containing protein/Tfp pilus assembly protein PilF
MTPSSDLHEKLRRYLLGQVDAGRLEEIEQEFLLNEDKFDELLAAEDALIDDYLNDSLNAEDRTAFEKHFRSTLEREELLRFGRAFRRHLSRHQFVPSPPAIQPDDSLPRMYAGVAQGQARRIEAQSPAWWSSARTFFSFPWRAAAFAILVLSVGLGVWAFFHRQSAVDEGLLALNEAYREQRPIESRISKFNYAPYVVTRGPGDERVHQEDLRRAELTLLNEQEKHPTPAAHHALGKVYLSKKDFDQAIKQFDEALKDDPKNAQTLSDLGAAWLEKGKITLDRKERGKSTEELGRSLENLNGALKLDPNLLEALFNRALCLQYLELPSEAEKNWRDYLNRDSTSAWAAEAARNLKQLEEQKVGLSNTDPVDDFWKAYASANDESAWLAVSQHRNVSGGEIANTLIDSYLELAARGQWDQSAQSLKALFWVARLEEEKAGDPFVRDLANHLSRLTASQRTALIDARRLLKLGLQKLIEDDSEAAFEPLKKAEQIFEQLGDKAEAIYVEYPIGHLYLAQKKSELALIAFEHVVREAEAHGYRWLMAQALNATANTQIGLTNHSAALEASERSLELSKQIGDTSGVIKTTNQLAAEYFRLGNYQKSLDLQQQSLTAANRAFADAMQLWRNYFAITKPLQALGLHAAAIEYAKEALRRAQAMNQPTEISRSYCVLGLMYAGDRNYDEAIRDANNALDAARNIPGASARQEGLAYSMLQSGVIYREAGDPRTAISNYDQAIESYRALDNFAAFVYVAHKGKLMACLQVAGCPFVEEEIRTSLDLFERHRANIHEVSNRLPFFDVEQDIYDIASEYEVSQGNYQRAFEYSERARGGTLREMANGNASLIEGSAGPDLKLSNTSSTMTLVELRAALPASAQVLQYSVLQDKVVIWLISRSQFIHAEQAIALSDLNALLRRYLELISSPSSKLEDILRDGAALYDILIRPVAKALSRDKLLCIVPDKTLNYLPFASLVPVYGKYLLDEFNIIRAPSSAMFVRSSANSSQKAAVENETLLSVGNPRFDRAKVSLPDLPSAEREAQEIKQFYMQSPRTTALFGAEATKPLVAAKMRQADVVHLALHSIVDEQSPIRSRLILAQDHNGDGSDDRGVLQAYEIYGTGMPITRLVVLSACDTNVGRYYGGEGTMGLSNFFIAAGVPLVVATLWSVDSEATAELMIEFHRLRKTEKIGTVEALRRAQQHMAHESSSPYAQPYYWAGFTVSGGEAAF